MQSLCLYVDVLYVNKGNAILGTSMHVAANVSLACVLGIYIHRIWCNLGCGGRNDCWHTLYTYTHTHTCIGYGGTLVVAGEMTAGVLTSFLLYSVYVGYNVGNLR
jgi:hypothetical protein